MLFFYISLYFFIHRIAVYDLGGGTFDISILEIQKCVFEVSNFVLLVFLLKGNKTDSLFIYIWIKGESFSRNCGADVSNFSPSIKRMIISHFVDYHLQPLVHRLPSFVKGTNDFHNKLLTISNLPTNSLLVTLDVSSLHVYTNIPPVSEW